MRRDAFTPEALPHWDAEFGDRVEVRPEYSARAHLDDVAFEALPTPARARQARAVRSALDARSAGLVSVPTSGFGALARPAGSLPAGQSGAEVVAARIGLQRELGAFVVDQVKRRLSMLRMAVGFAARAHAVSEKGQRTDVPWMVTLTYRPGVEWSSRHVSEALRKCRHWCKRRGFAFRYVWISEIQDGKRRADAIGRDVIHYHAVLWLPVGVRCPKFDSRGWWPHGMTQSKSPGKVRNAVGYLLHYLKKDKDLSAMPKGARAYGCGGLDQSLCRARRWLRLPAFVQGNSSIWCDWRRAVGGGWIAPNGSRLLSEFVSTLVGGVRCLLRVCTHPRVIEAAGPFSWVGDQSASLSLSH